MQLPLLPPSCPTCPVWTSPSSFPFHIIAISKPLFCLTVTQVRSALVLLGQAPAPRRAVTTQQASLIGELPFY